MKTSTWSNGTLKNQPNKTGSNDNTKISHHPYIFSILEVRMYTTKFSTCTLAPTKWRRNYISTSHSALLTLQRSTYKATYTHMHTTHTHTHTYLQSTTHAAGMLFLSNTWSATRPAGQRNKCTNTSLDSHVTGMTDSHDSHVALMTDSHVTLMTDSHVTLMTDSHNW